MKKVIVTGGSGFIGTNLVNFLIRKKLFVIYIDKLTYSSNKYKDTIRNKFNYKFFKLDINNKKKLNALIKRHKPKAIFNLAAETHVDRSIDGPKPFIHTNINGTFNILECLRKFKKKTNIKLIHISTDEVYGDIKNNLRSNEKKNYEPSSPYSASKAAADHLVSSYIRTYKINAVISNCCNNYGPFQFPEKLIPLTITNILRGKKIPIYGDGLNIRDWLFVEDHCGAIDIILNKAKPGSTYCIGGNNEIKNIDLVNQICVLIDEYAQKLNIVLSRNKSSDLISYIDDRLGHDKRYAINSEKLLNEHNWKPKIKFEEGLKSTVKWYLMNSSWWEPIIKN